jgi:hypothetical protein
MTVERDHTAERLARIELFSIASRQTIAAMVTSDPGLARRIARQLDALLKDVVVPNDPKLAR